MKQLDLPHDMIEDFSRLGLQHIIGFSTIFIKEKFYFTVDVKMCDTVKNHIVTGFNVICRDLFQSNTPLACCGDGKLPR